MGKKKAQVQDVRAQAQDVGGHDAEQMWTCVKCGTERQWGFGFPAKPGARPILGCDTCKDHRVHAFSRIFLSSNRRLTSLPAAPIE